jgi:hypothetical protein
MSKASAPAELLKLDQASQTDIAGFPASVRPASVAAYEVRTFKRPFACNKWNAAAGL